MIAILWILLAYGSYRIWWQLQLLDPDPRLREVLQVTYCKWQHVIAFSYVLLFQAASSNQDHSIMQLLQTFIISSLLLAAWTDYYTQLIQDIIYLPGIASGILWLIYYNPGANILINLIIFVAIQLFIFRNLYGDSDCLAYILCAMYLSGCGKSLIDYLLFMLLTVLIDLIVQIRKKNISHGKLRKPGPLIPYIAGAMLLYRFIL